MSNDAAKNSIATTRIPKDNSLTTSPSFTPGPWRFKPLAGLRGTEGYDDFDQAILGANDIVVGIVYEAGPKGFKHDPVNGFEANARLIAAAPVMYEALKAILPRLAHKAACISVAPTSEWSEKGSMAFDRCRCEIRTVAAALALARGDDTERETETTTQG